MLANFREKHQNRVRFLPAHLHAKNQHFTKLAEARKEEFYGVW